MRSRSLVLVATLAVLTSAPKSAADPVRDGVRIDQLPPASPESGAFFRAEGPHAPVDGVEVAAAAIVDFGKGVLPLYGVDQSGRSTKLATLVDDALLVRLGASITPVHWLWVDASLPISVYQDGDTPPAYAGTRLPATASSGVGDFRVGAHLRPIDERGFSLFLGGRVWAPIGSSDAYLGDSRFRGEIDLGGAGEGDEWMYACTLSASPGVFTGRDGDRAGAACALHMKLSPSFSIGLEPSFAVILDDLGPTEPTDTAAVKKYEIQIEPLAALRLRVGAFRLGAAVGPGFGNAMGTAELRALFSVGFVASAKPPPPPAAPPKDSDLDGIVDAEDACPNEAGPPSRDPKQNGCPARDRDGDGVRDDEDACPDRAGVRSSDPRANGCPDSDNDGLPDPIDQCKNEPGPPPTGCPRYARLKGTQFVIDPPIEFTSNEKLKPEGRRALEEIAATMRANPSLDEVSIAIGTKGAKQAVSDKRAAEIIRIFRSGNLDSNRYEVTFRDDLRTGTVVVRTIK